MGDAATGYYGRCGRQAILRKLHRKMKQFNEPITFKPKESAAMRTFKIRRSFAPHLKREAEDVEGQTGLTEEEAMEYCNDPNTRSPKEWFCLYVAE